MNLLPGATAGNLQASVRQVMSPGVIALSSDTTIGACASAMYERRTHAVLIIDQQTKAPLGWVSHTDVLEQLDSDPLTSLAADAISQQISLVAPETTVKEAAERMLAEGISHLLVADSLETIPEGVLSTWDVVSFYAKAYGRSP